MRQDYGVNWQGRLHILFLIVIIGISAIVLRLFQKQILEYPQYHAQAQKQHIIKEEIPAQRGKIFAKEEYGEDFPLAMNVIKYQVLVVPKIVKDPRQAAKDLARVLEMDEEEIFNKINNRKAYIPPIKKHLEKNIAQAIVDLNLQGVQIEAESIRYYPEGSLAGQIVGFVDADGNGRYGLEDYYDDTLKGFEGVMVAEQSREGEYINLVGKEVQERNGADLTLTLEHNVQYKAQEILEKAVKDFKADRGMMVVVDTRTGGILGMASAPNYDPNNYPKIAQENPGLFRTLAISDTWEPGSVAKPLTMAAALDGKIVEPDTQEIFGNCVTVQGYEICTAEKKAFGRETMTQVLENSDNVAMVWVAKKIGTEAMYRFIKSFGLGEKMGVDIQGEAAGKVPELKNWREVTRSTIAFGQGITVTPLQLTMAYATIANGGTLLKPHIVDTIKRFDGTKVKIEKQELRKVMNEKTTQQLTKMLISVVEKGHGKKAQVAGYQVAGKTGTAQIAKPGGGYYEDRHIGSFGGFFPADAPRFAMVVRLDNPRNTEWAESSAAPTFGEMAKWMLSYYRIAPTD